MLACPSSGIPLRHIILSVSVLLSPRPASLLPPLACLRLPGADLCHHVIMFYVIMFYVIMFYVIMFYVIMFYACMISTRHHHVHVLCLHVLCLHVHVLCMHVLCLHVYVLCLLRHHQPVLGCKLTQACQSRCCSMPGRPRSTRRTASTCSSRRRTTCHVVSTDERALRPCSPVCPASGGKSAR